MAQSSKLTQSLWQSVGSGARGALTAALTRYRRLVTPELRVLIPEGVRRLAKKSLGIKDPLELRLRLNELGFLERALDDLRILAVSSAAIERELAIWELTVWHANRRSSEGSSAALALLDRAVNDAEDTETRRRKAVLRAECHATLGDLEAANAVVAAAMRERQHPDLHLAGANLCEDPVERLARINEALRLCKLPAVSLRPDDVAPPYDRLMIADTLPSVTGPKISVIVPAFNAAEHIATAMEALIAQTWENLEVLVVDDLSTDSTPDMIATFSKRDPRIRLIRAEANRGAYVARNLGLREASGEFVTTHDSDDWSHPQKLEIQAQHLMSNPGIAANMSQQARSTSDLVFHRRGNPGHYIFDNMSSLMFRRELVTKALGFWDAVRFGADSEFIERLRRTFGSRSVVSLEALLSFQRQAEGSLTGSSAFGYHGFLMGARQAYHQASRWHHLRSKRLFYDFSPVSRPFAIPEPMWPLREIAKGDRRHFDVILVSDFRLPGKFRERNLVHVEKEVREGGRVGLVQMADYDFDPTAQVASVFRDLENSGTIQFIVFGEHVSCKRLVVVDPRVLEEFQRFVPHVEAGEIAVLVDEIQTGIPEAAPIWLDKCARNLKRHFGQAGTWYSKEPRLLEQLRAAGLCRNVEDSTPPS